MPGLLVVCATPIGNLGDAPPRLAEALGSADVLYAEDTRRSGVLLRALGVEGRIQSYFVGNEGERAKELAEHLAAGLTVALLTDAGTPSVADPGVSAVRAARQVGARVTVVPGPSALTAALAVSGFGADRFVFEGFLPRRGRARRAALASMSGETRTCVIFASPHRLRRELEDLAEVVGPERQVCVARELTKQHEEVWWGTVSAARDEWAEREPKGEFTLVVEGAPPPSPRLEEALEIARRLVEEEGVGRSEASRRAAEETGVRRRDVYEALTG